MFSSKKNTLLGLDIGSSNIKCVLLNEHNGKYSLEKHGIKSISPDIIVEGAIMDAPRIVDSIKELIKEKEIRTKDVALSVSGHSVIVKKIMLPTMTEDELEESIKWEAEQYIPFDINDVNIDFNILSQGEDKDTKGQMSVLLVAVKKDKIHEYTTVITEAGLNPVVVDIDAFAIENCFCTNYDILEKENTVALINIGASVMNINILRNGQFSFTRDISIGGNKYTETIQKEMNLTNEDAEKVKAGADVPGINRDTVLSIINSVNLELSAEITRSFDYFKSTTVQDNIDRVLLSGGTSKLINLKSFLSDRLRVNAEFINPFKNIEVNPQKFDMEYLKENAMLFSVASGLAIRKRGDR